MRIIECLISSDLSSTDFWENGYLVVHTHGPGVALGSIVAKVPDPGTVAPCFSLMYPITLATCQDIVVHCNYCIMFTFNYTKLTFN